jgi:hypothetical protein
MLSLFDNFMLRNFLIFSWLFFVISCASLSRSSVINHNPKDEVISIMSLEINYDDKLETRRDGIFGFCRIFFHDYELDLLKSRYEKNYSQGKNYSFHVMKSEPGRMMADSLS